MNYLAQRSYQAPLGLWGLCRLNIGYSGPIARISDGEGEIGDIWSMRELPAMYASAGSTDLLLFRLYDQTGSGRHVEVPSGALATGPLVYTASGYQFAPGSPKRPCARWTTGQQSRLEWIGSAAMSTAEGQGISFAYVSAVEAGDASRFPLMFGSATGSILFQWAVVGPRNEASSLGSPGGYQQYALTGQETNLHSDVFRYTLGGLVASGGQDNGGDWYQNMFSFEGTDLAALNASMPTDATRVSIGGLTGIGGAFSGHMLCAAIYQHRLKWSPENGSVCSCLTSLLQG
jgi:hypothetical protein